MMGSEFELDIKQVYILYIYILYEEILEAAFQSGQQYESRQNDRTFSTSAIPINPTSQKTSASTNPALLD